WLGVALSALMRCPREEKVQLTTEAVQRLAWCPEKDYRRSLLCECVEAYAPLDESQKAEVGAALVTSEGRKGMATTSIFDHWIHKGEERGREQGRTEEAR